MAEMSNAPGGAYICPSCGKELFPSLGELKEINGLKVCNNCFKMRERMIRESLRIQEAKTPDNSEQEREQLFQYLREVYTQEHVDERIVYACDQLYREGTSYKKIFWIVRYIVATKPELLKYSFYYLISTNSKDAERYWIGVKEKIGHNKQFVPSNEKIECKVKKRDPLRFKPKSNIDDL